MNATTALLPTGWWSWCDYCAGTRRRGPFADEAECLADLRAHVDLEHADLLVDRIVDTGGQVCPTCGVRWPAERRRL